MWCHRQLLLVVVGLSARARAECQSLECQPTQYNPDVDLDVPDLIRKYGYPIEIHKVTTDDGFILTLHRIPHGRKMSEKTSADGTGNRILNEIQTKEPVLMQHGLLSSSSCWILAPPEKAPAYMMADAGYDVWLGNARGNHYSRTHTRLSPDDEEFWDFSWDEMASLDLPAVIDYILVTTRHKQLYYIGHSMGTTMFFACMATKPDYHSKVKAMFGLGPVATVSYVTSPIKYLAPFASSVKKLMDLLGEYEFLPYNKYFVKWTELICASYEFEEIMCRNAVFFLTGFDAPQLNMTWLPVIFSHNPEGTSTRTLAHFAQEINSDRFEHYDFGQAENMRRYNQTTPPPYYLSHVNVPVALIWGKNDLMADPKDVALLAKQLPNLITSYKVPLPKFNHIDFLWGIDAGHYVYRVILNNTECLQKISKLVQHLIPAEREDLEKILQGHSDLFKDVPTQTTLISHDIEIGNQDPVKSHPYRVNPTKLSIIRKEVDYMLQHGLVRPCVSAWSSPCLLVPKPDGQYRLCIDYRKVNSYTKSDNYPIPRIEDCIDCIGQARYVSKLDLAKGYWQIPLTPNAQEISAFITPDGLYAPTVMPFGLKNAPATFQRLMNLVLKDVPNCRAYLDDIVIYHNSWLEHLEGLTKLFLSLRKANLTVNLEKCVFAKATICYLGHEVGNGKVMPLMDKIRDIVDYPVLTSRKEVQRYMGMCAYYRKFCKNFAIIAAPLTNLLCKNVKFKWTQECQNAFDKLKGILSSAPVLASPDYSKPFKLYIDASDLGAGAVLMQVGESGIDHPVHYYSRKFTKTQRNYSTVEKEALALLMAVKKFDVYISNNTVEVYTDHNPLTFLARMKETNQRILRWSLLLQEYDLVIKHVPGKFNVIADALSRLPRTGVT